MHDAEGMLPIPAMKPTIRCLLLVLGVAALGCATDYAERFRLAHPGWTPTPPRAGDSFEETMASLHAKAQEPLRVSVGELRVLRVDTLPWVRDAVRSRQRVLLEGQLGVGRDVNWGIYPYTTASSPTAGGACVGAGLPPSAIDEVLGVVKVYSTSVGGGPLPTELHDEYGTMLQEIGREFGATTGRPRRCGWFDGVAISYASWLNGFTGIAVTKLDVLDHFDEIQLCSGYRLGDEVLDYVPDTATQALLEPIYETWPGWQMDTSACRTWQELPEAARAYLRRIEGLARAPIRFVSVGPERSQMVLLPA